MSREYPDHLGELSTGALEDAMNELEAWVKKLDADYRRSLAGSGIAVSLSTGAVVKPPGVRGSGDSGYSFSFSGAHVPPEIFKCLKVIRLVVNMPRRSPWYGIGVDPEDSSVTVGVMMRNAFEAVGDWVDSNGMANMKDGKQYRDTNWFTRLYLPRWRQGKRAYNEWLDSLRELRITDENTGDQQGDKGQQ